MIIIINPTFASKCPIIITAIIIASLRAFRAGNLYARRGQYSGYFASMRGGKSCAVEGLVRVKSRAGVKVKNAFSPACESVTTGGTCADFCTRMCFVCNE